MLILGKKYKKILENPLKRENLDVLWLPDNQYVDKRLAGHVDLSMLRLGDGRLMAAPYLIGSREVRYLIEMGLKVDTADILQSENYPADAGLNMCVVGEYLIYDPAAAYKKAVDHLIKENGKIPIFCRQGYTRCSTCVVDGHSIITSDEGIAKAAGEGGLDVLKITPGHVILDGFSYGFIGGATFSLPDGRLAFTGRLDKHPDKATIEIFLEQRNVQPVYLTDEEIFDIGGGICI